ncbi:MAG: CehA/McbA family metallohydrolase [Neomegalonema sp.]|nr:CehA/McbA family metallohydrolase [Neomegalonema sp.]
MSEPLLLPLESGDQLPAFAAAGAFYRGNLHTHSTRSDGLQPPEEVCRRYRERGYDFLALTDHFIGAYGYPIVDTRDFRTNAFTTILGAEVHTGRMANGELWHLLAVGLPEDFTPPLAPGFSPVEGAENAADLARRAVEAGAFVAIAHPQWSGLSFEDAMSIEAAHAVEIYNHSCLMDSDRPDGTAMLDLMLSAGRRLTACATDDAHFSGEDAFGGWVMVKAQTLEPDALVSSLRAGTYYASQGAVITDARISGTHLSIASPDIARLVVCGPGSASVVVQPEAVERSDTGCIARAPLARFKGKDWIRAVIIDSTGKRAWTNPVWLED